jgi:hypothetical protein
MTASEIKAAVFRWETCRLGMERMRNAFQEIAGDNMDAPFSVSMDMLFDSYTAALSELLDSGDWLQWFWIENGGGSKGLVAGYGSDLRKIRTLNDLCWLIECAREL